MSSGPKKQSEPSRKPKLHRGRQADWPTEISPKGWLDIGWRVFRRIGENRLMLIAAGVTFYLLLAIFPAITAFVSLFGVLAEPSAIGNQLSTLEGIVPAGGLQIVEEQLEKLAAQDEQALGIGLIVALLVTFWSANNGVKTLFEALNIANQENEKRSFVRLNLIAFTFTLGAMLLATAMIFVVGIIPALLGLLNLGSGSEAIIAWLRWPILLIVAGICIALLYRYGPSREPAKWRWVTWGSALATLVWIAASAGFSFYLQNFADYNATYGSLGAIIGFMFWVWISSIILIVGAALNAEMEHQTRKDSTVGEPKPMGERGAVVADKLGPTYADR